MHAHRFFVIALAFASSAAAAGSFTSLVVNNAGDAGNGTCTTTCTLRDALANIAADGTITFDPTMLPATITLQKGELDIVGSVNILGPGAEALTISGANLSRVILANGPGSATLSDVTVRDGSVTGSNGNPGDASNPGGDGGGALGGCVYVAAQLVLQRVSIRHCAVTGGDGGLGGASPTLNGTHGGAGGLAGGGAVYVAGARLTLDESSIIDAHAFAGDGAAGGDGPANGGRGGDGGSAYGGAIYLATNAELFARNATIAQASAMAGNGGAGGVNTVFALGGAPGAGGTGGNARGGLVGAETSYGFFDFASLAEGDVVSGSGGMAGGAPAQNGQPGTAHGAALGFYDSLGHVPLTAVFVLGSSGAEACYGGPSPSPGASNISDDASCLANTSGTLAGTFRPLDTNAALPYYMPTYGSAAIDAGACTDHLHAPVTEDQQSTPRPQGLYCDVGAIETDYVFVAAFE